MTTTTSSHPKKTAERVSAWVVDSAESTRFLMSSKAQSACCKASVGRELEEEWELAILMVMSCYVYLSVYLSNSEL